MHHAQQWPWHGWMEAVISEHDGLCPWVLGVGHCRCKPRSERIRVPNLITTVARNMARDMLINARSDATIHYCALGSGTTAPAAGDTQLTSEGFRKPIIKWAPGAVGEGISTTIIAPADYLATIQEVGWFGGGTASSAANSGILVSHLLWTHTHTNLESLQLEHHDQF